VIVRNERRRHDGIVALHGISAGLGGGFFILGELETMGANVDLVHDVHPFRALNPAAIHERSVRGV
jgi:hypothetical protein